MTSRFVVYGLYEGDLCTYVGCTQNPAYRAQQHKSYGRNGDLRVIKKFTDQGAARDHEMMLIASWKPRDNRVHNCREIAGRTRMPTDEARKIWREDKFHTNAALISLMPGWTVWMAIYHFGARTSGNTPGHYTVRKREKLATKNGSN